MQFFLGGYFYTLFFIKKVSKALFNHDYDDVTACLCIKGKRLLTGSDDGTARVYETTTGECLLDLKGHGDAVVAAQFSPDGSAIATISNDRTGRVWSAASGDCVLQLRGHTKAVKAMVRRIESTNRERERERETGRGGERERESARERMGGFKKPQFSLRLTWHAYIAIIYNVIFAHCQQIVTQTKIKNQNKTKQNAPKGV